MVERSGAARTDVGPSRFGRLLRYWRSRRGLSQLELAVSGGGSQRHLSFLESGRSQPSQAMVLRLAAVLKLPLRERNRLLEAAGFPPRYPRRPLASPELASVREALGVMLQALEPYPVLVVDRQWTVYEANHAATRLMHHFARAEALAASVDDEGRPNVARLLMHPQGLRACVSNWPAVASEVLNRLEREAAEFGEDAEMQALLRECRAAMGPGASLHAAGEESVPVVPLVLADEALRLELVSSIATLGTAQDVTLQELRIETLFPADHATEKALRALAEEESG